MKATIFNSCYYYRFKQLSANKQTILDLETLNIPGIPDGLTVDTDGNVWVAVFDGGRVLKIDPRQPDTLLQVFEVPAEQTTSVTFGGANLTELYVTTGNKTFQEKPKGEGSGFVHVLMDLGIKGQKPNNVQL